MSNLFRSLGRLLQPLHRNESGQLVVFVAGGMVVVIGFAALSVDLGFLTLSRRSVQNDADAIALAAVRELPDEDSADVIALQWAAKNGVDPSEIQGDIVYGTTCLGDSVVGTATVRLARTQSTFFASIFGIGSGDLNVCATARIGWAEGGPGLLPFGFHYDDPGIVDDPPLCYYYGNTDLWDVECTLKIPKPSDTWSPGNTGPLRLDEGEPSGANNWDGNCDPGDSGANEFTENVEDGSECGYAPLDLLNTMPGAINNVTCDSIDTRINGNMDPFSSVFSGLEDQDADAGTPDAYTVVDQSHPRYALIPVASPPPGSSGASTSVTIETFITAYLVGCSTGANNEAVVTLIPANSLIFVTGIDFVEGGGSSYSTEWPLNTIKLVE